MLFFLRRASSHAMDMGCIDRFGLRKPLTIKNGHVGARGKPELSPVFSVVLAKLFLPDGLAFESSHEHRNASKSPPFTDPRSAQPQT